MIGEENAEGEDADAVAAAHPVEDEEDEAEDTTDPVADPVMTD